MKENLSEFLKLAYRHNKIRDVQEAFEEFPVEEEWHKGKVENILREDEETYKVINYAIGDIIFVKQYTYSDQRSGNNHLFVIIDQDNTAVSIENFGMLISSNLNKLKFTSNELLRRDELNHLHKNSLVKTDVIYKILNEQIEFKIGKVDMEKVEEYKKSFCETVINDKNNL
ncbi:MAG: hypothetical protein HFJ30_06255 [Clostridia bacterium]|nr:hypothetical protein [Clostridia bacterium]